MKEFEVIIIGSGFSGLCAAIKLQENNIDNYILLEREQSLGGTWQQNAYPGAAVDVPSHLYSFSFEPFSWSRLFAKQEELLAYTEGIIAKYKLAAKAMTSVEIQSLIYDEKKSQWQVNLKSGEQFWSKFIINGTGSLSQPSIPKFKGAHLFQGKYFHTSKWDHSFDYSNKSIAVIGTGASAVQTIPELAKKAKAVYVLQRTPHWLLPRPDRPLHSYELRLLKQPIINKIFRAFTYFKNESRALFFTKFPSLAKVVQLEGLHHLKKQIKDEQLRAKLKPNFDIGCKRILLCNDYYPALEKEHVHLKTSAIQEITSTGIKLDTKEEINVDLIVYATGFKAAADSVPFEIIGRNKLSIHSYWEKGAKAYYGTSVANFPNLFFLMGPNTGTGHTSVIYFIESQMNYILDALIQSKQKAWKSIEIRKDVQDEYNTMIQQQLKNSIWQVGNCKSWYQNSAGLNTTMYPNFSFVFRKHTKSFKEALHEIG